MYSAFLLSKSYSSHSFHPVKKENYTTMLLFIDTHNPLGRLVFTKHSTTKEKTCLSLVYYTNSIIPPFFEYSTQQKMEFNIIFYDHFILSIV